MQIRLPGFTQSSLRALGVRVRDIYLAGAEAPERVAQLVDDRYLEALSAAVAGELGGRAGVAPRLYLKKLIGDVLDRVDQFPDFDPRRDYALTVGAAELTETELEAAHLGDRRADGPPAGVDDIDLEL